MEWLGILSGIQQNFVIYSWFALSVFLLIKFYCKTEGLSILLEIKLNEFYLLLYVTVDGQWGTWGSWITCSVTCGGGSQSRTRTCTNPAPQYNGSPCPNSASSTQACNTHHCPSKCDHFYGIISKTPSSHVHYVMMFAFPYSRWGVEQLGLLGHVHRHVRRRNTG